MARDAAGGVGGAEELGQGRPIMRIEQRASIVFVLSAMLIAHFRAEM